MNGLPEWVGVGVGVVIRRGAEVLLVRRAGVHGDGTWSTPGGHIEPGESLEACAARETLEEVGVTVDEVCFLAVTNDVMPADAKHYVTVWITGRHAAGDPTALATDELDDVGWFAWDALPAPLFTSFDNLVAGRALGLVTPVAAG